MFFMVPIFPSYVPQVPPVSFRLSQEPQRFSNIPQYLLDVSKGVPIPYGPPDPPGPPKDYP